tara:strand:- start:157 stop:468 length:312 start_codon:yes stop_codon:yes gene_type:complete
MKLSRKVTVTIAVGIGLMLSSVGVASASPHYTDWSGTSGIKAELDMRMDQSTRSSFESKLEASKEQVRAKVFITNPTWMSNPISITNPTWMANSLSLRSENRF